MSDLKKGDEVSWNWGSGTRSGKVQRVEESKTSITSKNGNKISKDGDPENPAVVIEQNGKNPVVKRSSELNETDD
jgi:hypothetical protein